jgi:hypothetical protein
MSSHYVRRNAPPPGTSSFTRIRLGWITSDQVVLVRPGQEQGVFLSPLTSGRPPLVIKIPLASGEYYLIENRRQIGFDKIQPDFGLLILKVCPWAQEGSGTVKVMDAAPGKPNLSNATFRFDQEDRNRFIDNVNNVAVIPLWSQGEDQGVLITVPDRSEEAFKAALSIQELWQRYPGPLNAELEQRIETCIDSFKAYQFKRTSEIAHTLLQTKE